MRIQLPVEWWLDIFDEGMPREELAHKANQTSDSDFTAITQAWLHHYDRNVTLRDLILDFEHFRTQDGTYIKRGALYEPYWNEARQREANIRLPMARVPLPPNITSFQFIDIKYVDATLFEFLQKLRRLFTDVHIQFTDRIELPEQAEAMRHGNLQSWPHLLPLFAVKSMHIGNHEDFTLLLERFPATINGATAIFLYDLLTVPELEPYHNWLQNGRADGEPRLLRSFVPGGMQQVQLFRQAIQERFMASSKAVSYFIIFRIEVQDGDELEAEVHKNNATGEQLTLNLMQRHRHPREFDNGEELRDALFTRCPINVNDKWLEQKKRKACEWLPEERIINLRQPIECDLPDDQQQPGPPPAEQEQPGTSGSGGSTTEQQQQPGPSSASTDEQGPSTSGSSN